MHEQVKKYSIITFGCQANIYDSEVIAGILETSGFVEAKDATKSDLLVVNTCSVRQKSEDKVYGVGKVVAGVKEKNKELKAIMAGCMVGSVTGERQRYDFNELKKRTPWVDAYVSPSQIRGLPHILRELNLVDEWVTKSLGPYKGVTKKSLTFAPGEYALPDPKHAFVSISLGCDNFCTFCVVPFARGKETSRSKEEILKEIEHLTRIGYEHITLCGQNVNSWGLGIKEKFEIRAGSDQKLPFAALLRDVHKLVGVTRISFISSNPFDFTTDLIDALKLPKISRYLHIAVQSGSDEILKKMNRRHTIKDFEDLIAKIRKEVPEIEIGTDIIVGFPSETNEQFMETVALCERVRFCLAYVSIYSARKGTRAQRSFKDDVLLSEKKRRHAFITKVIDESKIKVDNRIK